MCCEESDHLFSSRVNSVSFVSRQSAGRCRPARAARAQRSAGVARASHLPHRHTVAYNNNWNQPLLSQITIANSWYLSIEG